MQASARAQERRWLRWGRVLRLGVVLGLLQFLLLTQATALEQWSTSQLLPIGIGAFLYLLIPTLAGFLAARQSEDTPSGAGSGCLVGGIGLLIMAVAITLASALTPPPPACQPGPRVVCGHGLGSRAAAAIGEAIIVAILFFEGLGSLFGGFVGGLIGGALGHRWASASNQRSAAAEEDAPQEAGD